MGRCRGAIPEGISCRNKNPRGKKELSSYETSVQSTENKGEHGTLERRSDKKL